MPRVLVTLLVVVCLLTACGGETQEPATGSAASGVTATNPGRGAAAIVDMYHGTPHNHRRSGGDRTVH
jgi:hypothetical protein